MFKKMLAGFALAMAGVAAQAAPINFSFIGQGDLTIGGTLYNDAEFEVSFSTDTDKLVASPIPSVFAYETPDLTGTLSVSGLGTGQITSNMYVFVAQSIALMGFGDFDLPSDLFGGFATAFQSYDFVSSVGPVSGTVYDATGQWQSSPLLTSLGAVTATGLSFTSFTATVSAAPVPEPETLALFAAGLAAVCLRRRQAS